MANVSCTWAVALYLISLYKKYISKAVSGVTVSLTCQLCSLLVYSRFVCIRNRVPNFPIFIDWISFSLNVTSRFPFQVLSVELDLWLWAFGIKCPSLQHHRTLSIYYWLQKLSWVHCGLAFKWFFWCSRNFDIYASRCKSAGFIQDSFPS